MEMNNTTSNMSLILPGEVTGPFSYFSLFSMLFFLFPVFVINVLLLLAIIRTKTLPTSIRIIIGNIVTASGIIIIGIVIYGMNSVLLSLPLPFSPVPFVCRMAYVTIMSGASGRLLYMTTYAITVYFLARYAGSNLRMAKMTFWRTLMAVLVIWMIAIIPNTLLFSPHFMEISFIHNDDCVAHGNGGTTVVFTFTFIVLYGICCFILSIIFPMLTVKYVKKNTIMESKNMLTGLMKFSVFLLIGNSINFTGASLPMLFGTFSPIGTEFHELNAALNYAKAACFFLSLASSPVIILIFFKPIRNRFKSILCGLCLEFAIRKHVVSRTSLSSTSNTSMR